MRRLSEGTKWLYGSGDLSFSLANTSIGMFFSIFLTDAAGIRPEFASVFIILGGVWDAITDPIMGAISDRSKHALGRRRPFILFGALPYALLYALIWWQPAWLGSRGGLFYYPLMLILFQTASTLVNMPFLALTPELSPDYDERNSLTSKRMIFNILGSLLVAALPMLFIGEFRPENSDAIRLVGIVTALLCFLPFLFIGLFIRERRNGKNAVESGDQMQSESHTSAQAAVEIVEGVQAPTADHFPGFAESIKLISANRAFRWALMLFLFSWLAIEVVQATLLYFIKYRLDMAGSSALIMGTVFVIALVSIPFWEIVSQRSDKRKSFIYGTAFWLVMQILLVTLNSGTPLVFILVVGGLAGIGVGAVHVFSWSVIPDSIDMGDERSRNQEGLYYSVVGFMRKVASKLTVGIVLLLLGLSGYEPNVIQDHASSWTLSVIFGPLPILFLAISIFSAIRYPVRRESIQGGGASPSSSSEDEGST